MKYYPFILFSAIILLLPGCRQETIVPEPYKPTSAYDAYRHSLEKVNLLNSALGKSWMASSKKALDSPVRVETPFKEAFYLDPAKAEAAGYRFTVNRGQKIKTDITVFNPDTMQLFIDLYRIIDDSLKTLKHVASADSLHHSLAFEPGVDAEYILRVQPELLRGGRFGITIQKVPSFEFPVKGKDSEAIGSYFGDPRDGGKREHHGVDIFAKRHTPVIAPTRAYVRRVGKRKLGGNVVWLRDSKGHNLYFAHLQTQRVEPNTYVEPGDTIGTVGNTGNARSTPPHLHFGIYSRGPVDPINFIKETNTVLPDVTSDLRVVGNWVRTRVENVQFLDLSYSVTDTLAAHLPLKVVGAIGPYYRTVLPDGTTGYINGPDTELASEPIQQEPVKEPFALLAMPDTTAVPKENLKKGEILFVLARHKNFWFVRTSLGKLGWVNGL